ncbi:MAG: DUF2203 domain-containing protein [Chloroflexi bacterium]|nr:DUF2203 domain-containing protein [Chloroflexota bacterium]
MNQIKQFTVAEANSLLPQIKPLMAQLLEKRAKIVVQQRQVAPLLADLHLDVGGPELSALTQEFALIERLIERIQEYGCLVRDINVGLLDFPAQFEEQMVFLCWRYGEDEIAYYHDVHEGFNGRSPLH